MTVSCGGSVWSQLVVLLVLLTQLQELLVSTQAGRPSANAVQGEPPASDGVLSITELHRIIDLTTNVAQTTTTFTVRNRGAMDLSSVLVAVATTHRVAYMSFETADGKALSWQRHVGRAATVPLPVEYDLYAVTTLIPARGSLELTSYIVCAGAMAARPAAVSQGEPQYMSYRDQLYAPTPYAVSGVQVTELVLPTPPRHYPITATAVLRGRILKYGPLYAAGPWAVSSDPVASAGNFSGNAQSRAGELRINFEHNASPFFIVNALTRTVELSHWGGRLAITDRYHDLRHSGAKIHEQQGWSRLEHEKLFPTTGPTSAWQQSNANHIKSSAVARDGTIRSFIVRLPARAIDGSIFFRDEVGNVSTSHIERSVNGRDERVNLSDRKAAPAGGRNAQPGSGRSEPARGQQMHSLVLRPRFPIVGGWKVSFETGYSTQLSDNLHIIDSSANGISDTGRYTLILSPGVGLGICPWMEGIVAENYTLKIVLPEGATDIAVHAPPGYFGLDGTAVANNTNATSTWTGVLGKWWSILDVVGRPVVVLSHSLLVEKHCSDAAFATAAEAKGLGKGKPVWQQQPQLQISYSFDCVNLMWEPVHLVGLWGLMFGFFATCDFVGRV